MEEAKAGKNTTAPQSVKLQKYTITPFSRDYKDWLRFWNQFTVEVDGAAVLEISKFNYRLKLVKGKPKEDILGLPHTEDGYGGAKRILEQEQSTQFQTPRVEKSMNALMNHASTTLHPTVLAKIGEEEVRVMFDSGAGSIQCYRTFTCR